MPAQENPYPTKPDRDKGEFPDLFALPNGRRAASPEAWAECARRWRDQILDLEYGGLPPAPEAIGIETLCSSQVRRFPGKPRLRSYRVKCRGGAKPFAFCVRILAPDGPGPFPAIVNGDGCWWYLSDALANRVVGSGCALVMFNRTEMAADLGAKRSRDDLVREGGLCETKCLKDFRCFTQDREEFLAFYDSAAEHCAYLRTTNPNEATLAKVSNINRKTKCIGSRKTTLANVFMLIMSAESH